MCPLISTLLVLYKLTIYTKVNVSKFNENNGNLTQVQFRTIYAACQTAGHLPLQHCFEGKPAHYDSDYLQVGMIL